MPIFAGMAEPRRSGEAGFTLVELMLVLAIMGLAAATVMLTLPDSQRGARDEADRLAARLAAVRDLAVIEGRGTAAVISASGYGFERRMRGQWQSLDERAFARRAWPGAVRFQGADNAGQARILFSRLGTSPTPQSVTLISDDQAEKIHIAASGEISRGD